MKFLQIDASLLTNKSLRPLDKMIVAYLDMLQKNGKSCFANLNYLSNLFGVNQEYMEQRINKLSDVDIVVQKNGITSLIKSLDWCSGFTFKGEEQVKISDIAILLNENMKGKK